MILKYRGGICTVKMRDTVVIGWLDPGQVDGLFALSLSVAYAERRARIAGLLRVQSGGLLSWGRNRLAAQFLDATDAEWLLMVDADEQLSVEAFDKLCDAAHDKDRPIVSGLVMAGWPGEFYPAAMPAIFRDSETPGRFNPILDYPADTVIPIDSAGTGCLLTHRSVFEAMRADATPHQGADWCWFQDMPINGDWFSEDHWFCARARELGFTLHAHTGATLPHRKSFWLTERHHRPQETAVIRPALERR